jgi:elongation factor P
VAKGDTVSSTLKDAELDNGITVKVPAFIKQDEDIKVNPSSGEYSSRAKND